MDGEIFFCGTAFGNFLAETGEQLTILFDALLLMQEEAGALQRSWEGEAARLWIAGTKEFLEEALVSAASLQKLCGQVEELAGKLCDTQERVRALLESVVVSLI